MLKRVPHSVRKDITIAMGYVIYNTKMMKPEDFFNLFDPGGCFIFPAKEKIKTIIRQKT